MSKRKASLGLNISEEVLDPLPVSEPEKQTKSTVKKSSKSKQSIPVYIDPLLHEALHALCFSERHKKTSFQTLFLEGLDMALEKRGLPSVDELSNGTKTINP